jgi:AraC family transcriptional regulator
MTLAARFQSPAANTSESASGALPASGAGQDWLGNSVWQGPKVELSGIKSWASITAMSYQRDAGETIWRGDRPRLVLSPDQLPPMLVQVEQGHTRQMPLVVPGSLTFFPPGVTLRIVPPAAPARFVQAVWDMDLYSTLLPELGAAVSRFEFLYALQDPLLGQIAMTLAQETDGGFGDRILIESLGAALCIRIARRFVGRLPLPTSGGLSPERLKRVRDYVEVHLDEDLSLTTLADIACLSPYHFSRSFKEATGVGPQRYVIQRRVERSKRLMRQTHQPLALIALVAGFADQSHFTIAFRREIGVTPGAFRAGLA